ncbi:AEC family transporter [[Acholeplasma] multilocale]|uniref:AEC family transporter n=1 Tax=[Acholeplasma] multilocale TaxID=264638 RepID=UPI0004798C7B|nr:AEC family transporter [[Acholeplasma] multilocale]
MNLYASSEVSDAILKVVGSWPLWTAIGATIFVIGLGYFFTVKGVLKKDWDKVFIKIVMLVGLPALALNGFLNSANIDDLKREAMVILIGFLFYFILVLIAKYFFYKSDKDVRDTLAMCVAFGSTTFFAIPLIKALSETLPQGEITGNNFNIPYRVFLYTMGFTIMSKLTVETVKSYASGKKVEVKLTTGQNMTQAVIKPGPSKKELRIKMLKNIFANPIIICTFIGFIIWATQLIPGIQVMKGGLDKDGLQTYYSPLRIDLLFPPSKSILSTLAGICTPLSWIAIGMTIAKGKIKNAMKSKTIWYATIIRIFAIPVFALVLVLGIAGIIYAIDPESTLRLTKTQLTVILMMAATPPANVIVAYAINYNKAPEAAAGLTSLSTLGAVIAMPLWVVVGIAIGSTPLFAQVG